MKILITGSNGLIGSQCVEHFCSRGDDVMGIDNDMRFQFFGESASTMSRGDALIEKYPGKFDFFDSIDIRNREDVKYIVEQEQPDVIIHTAAQPSHDKAAEIPFIDFEINAGGTLNLLEAARQLKKMPIFVHMSTNKVYGDNPNRIPGLWEYSNRYDIPGNLGVNETMSIDGCTHSLFGVSKLYADQVVLEYGRYFGMKSCVLRGGCLTGPNHAGVEAHGFLNHLVRSCKEGKPYTIYGFKGKQVRDNIHAYDVAKFIEAFVDAPRVAEAYNLGGGWDNSISIIEAIELAEEITGRRMITNYVDKPRKGDHICYISDLTKCKTHYPSWSITKDLRTIFTEIANGSGEGR